MPVSESATRITISITIPIPNTPILQILLPALPRPISLPRRPPVLSLFQRRGSLIFSGTLFDKSFHANGADGVEEVVDYNTRWPAACLGGARAEAALGTAAVPDADAAEERGRGMRRVTRVGGVEAVVRGEGAVVGDVTKGAVGLAGARVTTLPAVVGEARDVRWFGCFVSFFLRHGLGGVHVRPLHPFVSDATGWGGICSSAGGVRSIFSFGDPDGIADGVTAEGTGV